MLIFFLANVLDKLVILSSSIQDLRDGVLDSLSLFYFADGFNFHLVFFIHLSNSIVCCVFDPLD